MDMLSSEDGLSSTSRVSSTKNLSLSPSGGSHLSFLNSVGGSLSRTSVRSGANVKHLKPFATEDFKILLLENVNKTGRDVLAQQGYQVEFVKTSLPEDELIERIRWGSSLSLDVLRE